MMGLRLSCFRFFFPPPLDGEDPPPLDAVALATCLALLIAAFLIDSGPFMTAIRREHYSGHSPSTGVGSWSW